jgi:hypothetical protein
VSATERGAPFALTPLTSPRSVAVGKVQGTVDCSAKEALTWWNMPLAREPTRASREHGNHARVLLTERSRHDFSWALVAKMPFFLLSREFLGRYICF